MNKKQENSNIWKIGCIISIIIIILLVVWVAILKDNENGTKIDNETKTEEENENYKQIRIDEDLNEEGTIKNLENVRWNNARITQDSRSLEVSIYVNNESETEVIPAKTITMKLYDKDGNKIAEKDIEMEEIEAQYGYTTLEAEFDITDPIIIDDIELIAK